MATILIVDERPPDRASLIAVLGDGGHRLLEAGDGPEALAIARAERPDLILADLFLPTMDGSELVRQLRFDPKLAETPVLFLAARHHDREARALARVSTAAGVLIKASEPQAVIAAIEAALRRETQAAAPEVDRGYLLRRANDRLSALIELGLRLSTELDPRRLLKAFCRSARELIGARYAIAGIVDGDGTSLRYLFSSGMDAEMSALLGSPDPTSGPMKIVLSEGRAHRLINPSGFPAALGLPENHPPVHAWLGAPIGSPSGTYGWLGLVDRIGLDEFSEEDERLAALLSAQVGRIYQYGTMYSELERRTHELEKEALERQRAERRQEALLDIHRALGRSATLPEAAYQMLRAICRRLSWDFGCVWLVDRERGSLKSLEVWQAPSSDTASRGLAFVERVWRSAQPSWSGDAFAFPIMLGDQVLGVIELCSARSREPDSELLRVFEAISGPFAQLIERKLA